MTEWIALSRSQHAGRHYLPREGYAFATNQAVASILLAELAKLLPHYALGFIEQGEGHQPVALLSLDLQTNLYVAPNGKWLGSYVPASLRGYPFTLANTEDGQKALCIDQAYFASDQGEPLFDTDGNLGQQVARTLDFLEQCEKNRPVTLAATKALSDAGVIEPWPLQIERGEGQEPLKLNGLFRVSEEALNALEADAYTQLRGGPMALAHAQLFSMSQLNQLTERARFHAQHHSAAKLPESLDALFREDDDLAFDFNN
ncbi:MAG: SapC family protein [Gammaproteobacteria bacterium]|nr:SapC family protein [Gammaproteobacteria bacterium]